MNFWFPMIKFKDDAFKITFFFNMPYLDIESDEVAKITDLVKEHLI